MTKNIDDNDYLIILLIILTDLTFAQNKGGDHSAMPGLPQYAEFDRT